MFMLHAHGSICGLPHTALTFGQSFASRMLSSLENLQVGVVGDQAVNYQHTASHRKLKEHRQWNSFA